MRHEQLNALAFYSSDLINSDPGLSNADARIKGYNLGTWTWGNTMTATRLTTDRVWPRQLHFHFSGIRFY
jgi:hypothetical protein